MLMRYRASAVPWGLSRLVLGARGLNGTPGLRFARVLGSGRDGGFGLAPSVAHQGLIAFFDDQAAARSFLAAAPAATARRARADESLSFLLSVTSSRGTWDGVALNPAAAGIEALRATAGIDNPPAAAGSDTLPVASLTRAAIRPRHARRFWRHAPASEASLAAATGCRLAVGLGEAPLLRQATFSLWDDDAALRAYAHGGAHLAASRAAWQHDWFSEWMFVRFAPVAIEGRWRGRDYG